MISVSNYTCEGSHSLLFIVVFNVIMWLMKDLNFGVGGRSVSHISCCLLVFPRLELSPFEVPLQGLFEATCPGYGGWVSQSYIVWSSNPPNPALVHRNMSKQAECRKWKMWPYGRPAVLLSSPLASGDMTSDVWHMAEGAYQSRTMCY